MFDARPANEMDVLASAAAGMSAQRTVLDLAARNVAAAQASSPGHPYARLVAQFRSNLDAGLDGSTEDGPDPAPDGDEAAEESQITGIRSEPGTGDSLAEMISALDAQRAYEQQASVFDIGKRLAERTIDIGRG